MSDLNDLVCYNANGTLALTAIDEGIDVASGLVDNAYGLLSDAVGECVACHPVGSVVKALWNAIITYNKCREEFGAAGQKSDKTLSVANCWMFLRSANRFNQQC